MLTNKTAEEILASRELRLEAGKTLIGFALIYCPHYFDLPPADFHPELFVNLADWEKQFLAIAGFRGSAKSTIAGTVFALWAGLNERARFIIPINETEDVSKLTIANIREELENNELIQQDYAPQIRFGFSKTKFSEKNILLANGVRYFARSRGQKIRGLRHRQYRPDLVIVDDPEELKKVKSKAYRDETENWLKGDIIPSITEFNSRLIVLGNILHTDSLMPRLKNHPIFEYYAYPLVDEKTKKIRWLGKFPNQAALDRQEKKVGRTAWLREYLLKVVPPEGQEIQEGWIQYYDELPGTAEISHSGVGTDLAISKKETADFTAMVKGFVAEKKDDRPRIYILPHPINERMSFHETLAQGKALYLSMQMFSSPDFFLEDVGYQRAAIEEFSRNMLPVKSMHPGSDKRARLRSISSYIQDGTILFPRTGCEDLLDQILNFGIADHDDLMDAFVYLVLGLVQNGLGKDEIFVL